VTRRRLDAELVRRGLAGTREEARDVVRSGRVRVGGREASTPASMVAADEPLVVRADPAPFVSRGGSKLEAGLEAFSIDVTGRGCLDAGASTGGFTDVLLQRGAGRVIAVDVGYGQLDWRLRTDERVTVLERTNVRDLDPAALPFRPDVVVADLSFVSLRSAAPALVRLAAPGAQFVLLVKPQFEAPRADVGRGGVVTDPGAWRRSIEDVAASLLALGVTSHHVVASPTVGPAGNVEFLLHARGAAQPTADERVGARGPATLDGLDDALAAGEALRA
jgi:23S rRNA (cytidine1920-2'-O)/16S rRNA (cytidine1409-2'-O)-methyltransferase